MEKQKRFLVFGYDTYYPNGGMNDCINSFDTIEDAKKEIFSNLKFDYYEIFDRIEGVIIELKSCKRSCSLSDFVKGGKCDINGCFY